MASSSRHQKVDKDCLYVTSISFCFVSHHFELNVNDGICSKCLKCSENGKRMCVRLPVYKRSEKKRRKSLKDRKPNQKTFRKSFELHPLLYGESFVTLPFGFCWAARMKYRTEQDDKKQLSRLSFIGFRWKFCARKSYLIWIERRQNLLV